MITFLLSLIIFFLPLSGMQIPQFGLSEQHCQTVVTLLEEKAEQYSYTNAITSQSHAPSIRELSRRYNYKVNCSELDQIIDEARAKMVKHQSNNPLTQMEYTAQLNNYIMEGIQCKEIEHMIKNELKLQ